MASKRKNNPNQPELPIDGGPGNGGKSSPQQKPDTDAAKKTQAVETSKDKKPASGNGNGNGHAHVLAENVVPTAPIRPFKPGNIELPLHRRVDRGFLDYASYVIRDRAIPNLADGLKPAQPRTRGRPPTRATGGSR